MDARDRISVSLSSLLALELALLQFSERADARIGEICRALEAGHRSLALVQADAVDDVQRLERADESDDDDAGDEYSLAHEQAMARLRRIDRGIENLADSRRQATTAEVEMAELLRSGMPSALSYTRDRITRLEAILRMESVVAPRSEVTPGTTAKTPKASAGSAISVRSERVLDTPLPSGFIWVPLKSISRTDDLRANERYHKVPALEVFEGFLTLRDVVLPHLTENRQSVADDMRRHDATRSATGQGTAHRAYEAFFGAQPITLARDQRTGAYTVTDGRHRIHVARALGWYAVPAREHAR